MRGVGEDPAPHRIAAHWAEWGKVPGDKQDYRVVTAHNDRTNYYNQNIMPFVPGTLSDRAPLPWFVFAYNRADGPPWASFSALDFAGHQDALRRPAVRMRYFSVAFEKLAQAPGGPVGYAAQAAALATARGRYEPDELAELSVPRTAWTEIARAVQDDFAWFASGAAGLLAGPVVVNGARDLGVDQRLRILDAITALLPYGARAGLAAATCADSKALHEIRLYFGEAPPARSTGLTYAAAAPEASGDGTAGRYYGLLCAWRDALAQGGEEDPVAYMVRRLARDAEKADLVTDPKSVLRRLGEAANDDIRVADRKRPVTEVAESRAAVLNRQMRSPSMRRTHLRDLLRNPGRHVTARAYDEFDLGYTEEDFALIVEVAAQGLRLQDGVAAAARYARRAEQLGLPELDRFLAELIDRVPDVQSAPLIEQLITQLSAQPQGLRLTQRALTRDVAADVRLLDGAPRAWFQAKAPRATLAREVAENLRRQLKLRGGGSGPPHVRFLAQLDTGRRQVGREDLTDLCGAVPGYPLLVLHAATAFGRVPEAVDALLAPLLTHIARATWGLAVQKELAAGVDHLTRLEAAIPCMPQLRLIRLFLEAPGGSSGPARILEAAALLSDVLDDLDGDVAAVRRTFVARVGAVTTEPVGAVLSILAVDDRFFDEALAWLRGRPEPEREILASPQPPAVHAAVEKRLDELRTLPGLLRCARLAEMVRQEPPAEDLATELRGALDLGVSAPELVRLLEAWPAVADPHRLDEVFTLAEGTSDPGGVYHALALAAVSGGLPPQLVREFRICYAQRLTELVERLDADLGKALQIKPVPSRRGAIRRRIDRLRGNPDPDGDHGR